MVSVNCPSWEKAASFGILEDTVYSLSESHTVADLVNLASNELPLDTGAAFQEAQSAAGKIMDQVIRFDNLEPLAFLTSQGKAIKIKDADDLDKRSVDITYMKFRCFFMDLL